MSQLLKEDTSRFTLFPIKYPRLYKKYQDQLAVFWNTNECDLESDLQGWNKLNEQEQSFLLQILGFFAASDGIVMENLMSNFSQEVTCAEARNFFAIQAAIEAVHSEQYSLLIQKFATEEQQKQLFNSIENHQSTKAKADWAISHMQRKDDVLQVNDFASRLVAFACVEGIMFSSSFCAIYYFRNRAGINMPGLYMSNELISRDEGLHRDFAIELYKEFPRLAVKEVKTIITSAVELEKKFVEEILPEKLKGMNKTLMKQYVEYVGDHLAVSLGYPKIYNSTLPEMFQFMDMLSLEGKSNFFERRVSEYSLAGVGVDNNSFGLDSSF